MSVHHPCCLGLGQPCSNTSWTSSAERTPSCVHNQAPVPCTQLIPCTFTEPDPSVCACACACLYSLCRPAGLSERRKRDQAALADLNTWTATLSTEQRAAFDAASSPDTPPTGPVSSKVAGPGARISRRASDRMYLTGTGELVTQAALRVTLLRSNTTAVLLSAVPAGEAPAVPPTAGEVRTQNWAPECDIKKGLATQSGLICGKQGTIAIRGGNAGQWCTNDYDNVIRCNRYEGGEWEVFQVTPSGGSREWYTLHSMATKAVCGATLETPENPYDGEVKCDLGSVAKVKDNLRFTQILCGQAGDRRPIGWSITTRASRFCSDDWDSTLRCDRGTLATWEVHSVFCWKVSTQQWQECTPCV